MTDKPPRVSTSCLRRSRGGGCGGYGAGAPLGKPRVPEASTGSGPTEVVGPRRHTRQ